MISNLFDCTSGFNVVKTSLESSILMLLLSSYFAEFHFVLISFGFEFEIIAIET